MLTIAIQTENAFRKETFTNFEEFADFHLGQKFSCHYEIINGKQNLFFDLDNPREVDNSDFSGTTFISNLIDKLATFVSSKVPTFAILVYSSSDTKKTSFHILVRGLHYADHRSCGQSAKSALGDIAGFDSAVYTANRNFRLLGSRKIDSTRIKGFLNCTNHGYYNENEMSALVADPVFALRQSFIGFVDDRRSRLMDTPDAFATTTISSKFPMTGWTDDLKTLVCKLVDKKMPGTWTIRDVSADGIFLNLRRLKSAKCPLCERVHDTEGSFVVQRNDGRRLVWYCRRDTSQSLTLEDEDDETISIPIVGDAEHGKRIELIARLMETCREKCTFYGT